MFSFRVILGIRPAGLLSNHGAERADGITSLNVTIRKWWIHHKVKTHHHDQPHRHLWRVIRDKEIYAYKD